MSEYKAVPVSKAPEVGAGRCGSSEGERVGSRRSPGGSTGGPRIADLTRHRVRAFKSTVKFDKMACASSVRRQRACRSTPKGADVDVHAHPDGPGDSSRIISCRA